MSRLRFALNRLATLFILSCLSVFSLDGVITVILIMRPPRGLSELAIIIFLSTFLRAALADWSAVNVMVIRGSYGFKLRFFGFALAALVYGVPLLIVSEFVFKPLQTVLLAPFLWLDKVLPVMYVNDLVGVLLYALIFDFSRLMLFFELKNRLLY